MSRRKRTSWMSTGRSTGALQLLRELDAVAVGVVDVEEAHHALRDLDDDADLDALVAQAVGLCLHVLDVDVRYDAVVARVALGEADLHRAALQVRPALLEVDGHLLELQRVAIEATGVVEALDVVPDGG